VSSRLY